MRHMSLKHNDKGYTLVELIITIAIIVVLTGAAMVTIFMMHSAKAREASVTFTSELSETATKSRSQMIVMENPDTGEMENKPTYKHCLMIYKHDNGNYYIKKGYYNPDGATADEKYIFDGVDERNGGKGISISSRITIKYTAPGTDAIEVEKCYIVYDRNGKCIEGSGRYGFYKRNGNLVADVNLNKNGSYQSE